MIEWGEGELCSVESISVGLEGDGEGGGVFFNNIILTHQRHPRLCLRICSSTVLLHLNSKHTLTGALGRTAPAARMKGYVRV